LKVRGKGGRSVGEGLQFVEFQEHLGAYLKFDEKKEVTQRALVVTKGGWQGRNFERERATGYDSFPFEGGGGTH